MSEFRDDAAERALDAVARAMTAHPAPDVASAVRARLGAGRATPAARPGWTAAALAAAAAVVVAVWLAPERPVPASPATTVARGPRPPAGPAPVLAPAPTRPAPRVLAPAATAASRAAAASRAPALAEPWPGDELKAAPLRLDPLTEPSLAIDGIELAPLAGPAPLEFEAVDVSGRGEEE